jgi:glycyl-tRNA synthetase beta subunit
MRRMSGIAKDAKPVAPGAAKLTGAIAAKADADRTILELVTKIAQSTEALETESAVQKALQGMEVAAVKLDEIFEGILVNDPADKDTPVRLGVLSYGAQSMLRLGDFTRLV